MSKEKAVAVSTENMQTKALEIKLQAAERAKALKDLGVETKDLVIATIQVMQNTSGLVAEEKAKLGQIVNMQTEALVGGIDTPVQILPLKLFKTLRVYDVSSGFKFLREEPLTSLNEKSEGEGMENGIPVKRYHTFNFFVLLKKDMEKGEGFPCLVRFRSTGMNAGRQLATYLYKLVFFNKKPYTNFVGLSTKKEKKDTNVYAVPVIETKSPEAATPEQVAEAESWLAMLAAGNYKVAEENEESDAEARAASAKPVVVDAEVVGSEAGEY